MSRADLHLVADMRLRDLYPPTLGDAIAAYYGDATQDAIDRADDHMTRNEDDDYGDVDGLEYQRRVRDLHDALRKHKGAR